MSEKYKVIDSSVPNFVTLTLTEWVDLFIRPLYCKILDDALNFCIQNKGLVVHAYVYMTSHLHLIVSSKGEPINFIIRDFKKFTAKKLVAAIKEHPESRREWILNKFQFEAKRTHRASSYKVWRDGFHPVILNTNKKIEQRVHYTHYNPVVAKFVYHEIDWVNSSYCAYEEDNPEQPNVTVKPLW